MGNKIDCQNSIFVGKESQDIKIMLNRKDRIKEIGFININTTENASIFVFSVTILSIDTKERYFVDIRKTVTNDEPTENIATQDIEEMFRCQQIKWSDKDEEERPPKQIDFMETVLFFCNRFLYI